MVEAVLTGSPRDSAQDPALRLDRLLLALDQKPSVYDVTTAKNKNGWTQQTVYTYSVELQLRPRCNIFQFSDDKLESTPQGGDWDRSFPTLTSSPSNSPTLGSSTPPSAIRYPPIQRTATSAKREEAKAEVANNVLQRIRVYQSKYPLLFQISQSQPLPTTSTTSTTSASSGTYSSSFSPTSTTRFVSRSQRPGSPSSSPAGGHVWNRNTPPFQPRTTLTPFPNGTGPSLRYPHPTQIPRS